MILHTPALRDIRQSAHVDSHAVWLLLCAGIAALPGFVLSTGLIAHHIRQMPGSEASECRGACAAAMGLEVTPLVSQQAALPIAPILSVVMVGTVGSTLE